MIEPITPERSGWLTIDETLQVLRASGMNISNVFLMHGLEDGIFPFGFCIEGQSRRFYVSRRKLDEWLKEWA